jgi:Ser/Thr protein kinase RdoA (MazF antagonist)
MTAIDFDDCMINLYAVDVERSLNCIREEAPGRYACFREYFIKGYTGFFRWDAGWEDRLALLRAFSQLYRMARILRSCEDSEVVNPPDWFEPMDECRQGFDAYLKGEGNGYY